MLDKLHQYLKKIGAGSVLDLSPEERTTYESWHDTLTKEITLENVEEWLSAQIKELNEELRVQVTDNNTHRALFIAARLENYTAWLAFIREPEQSRKALAEHLDKLLDDNQ